MVCVSGQWPSERTLLTTHFRVLVPTTQLDTLDILASCETFRRPILLWPQESSIREATAYSIASVFVPEACRRRGYAERMCTLLHERLAQPTTKSAAKFHEHDATWGPRDGILSVLFSDVGDFYSRCLIETSGLGWQIQCPREVVWTIKSLLVVACIEPEQRLTPILDEDLTSIAQIDRDWTQTELASTNLSHVFTFLFDGQETSWLATRAMLYAQSPTVERPLGAPLPTRLGARLHDEAYVICFTIFRLTN